MTNTVPEVGIIAERHPDPIGTLALPYRETISAETHVSFMGTDFGWTEGRLVNRLYVNGSQLPLQRNLAIHAMQGDWVLFIDDDMVFGKNAIGNLVASYHALKAHTTEPIMVGGLCVRRYPPFHPTMYRALDMERGPFRVIEDWDEAAYVECDGTGAAFLLIETDVFSAIMGGPFPNAQERAVIKEPWPFFEWWGQMGEDLVFSLKARNAGVRIFVDTRIVIGHVATQVVDIEDFWRAMALRSEVDESTAKAANDSIGLRTLTAEVAHGRLRRHP